MFDHLSLFRALARARALAADRHDDGARPNREADLVNGRAFNLRGRDISDESAGQQIPPAEL